MTPRTRHLAALSAACALAFGVSACSMDEVSLNGGVFDMVGMSDDARAKNKGGDPQLAERAPLVMPPNAERLPPPGEADAAPVDPQMASIRDPDVVKKASKEELAKAQAAYCREHYELPKARGDDSADSAVGPAGPCRPSVLNALNGMNSSDE